mgnify:CR=1 FL=1
MTRPTCCRARREHIDADRRAHRDAARARPRLPHRRRLDLLPDRVVARLRAAGPPRPGAAAGRRARRGRRIRQGRRPRLRAVEGPQARRAVVGDGDRPGPARLAHRVLGDEHGAPRAVVRHPHRRRRPDLPAPRGRDRPERGRDRPDRSSRRGCTARISRWRGAKMAKSAGNIARVGELLDGRRLAAGAAATRSSRSTTGRRSTTPDDVAGGRGGSARPARRGGRARSRPTARTGRTTPTLPRRLAAARGRVRGGARRRPQRLGRRWRRCSTSCAT